MLTTACRGRRSQRPPPAEHSSTSGRPSLSPEVESPLLHQSDADDVCVHGGALRPPLAEGTESCRAVEASPCSVCRTAVARRSIILRLSYPLAHLCTKATPPRAHHSPHDGKSRKGRPFLLEARQRHLLRGTWKASCLPKRLQVCHASRVHPAFRPGRASLLYSLY